jgi:hypothetical protein
MGRDWCTSAASREAKDSACFLWLVEPVGPRPARRDAIAVARMADRGPQRWRNAPQSQVAVASIAAIIVASSSGSEPAYG